MGRIQRPTLYPIAGPRRIGRGAFVLFRGRGAGLEVALPGRELGRSVEGRVPRLAVGLIP